MNAKIPLICVVGPTASGKTALGVQIAERFGGEIVSADSMQLYRGIHIASAAPDAEEMRGIPHHLIEFLSPGERFTVAEYVAAADAVIADIRARGRQPVVVGGTGLYIDSLVEHIRFSSEPDNGAVRARLREEAERLGAEAMLSRLAAVDPQSAARLHPNDLRRILRALEVYELTGKTFTEQLATSKAEDSPYDALILGLTFLDRERLYARIDRRVDEMLERGLEREALERFGKDSGGAGQAIGHKELYGFFHGELTREQAVENLKRATRRYAKRQLTWFRRNGEIRWIYADEADDVAGAAMQIIEEWRKNREE